MDIISLVAFFHVGVALLLIIMVLLQDPKGGGAAGMFGGGGGSGGSQSSFFGASGAGSFLSTLTKWLAIIFAVSSIGMTYMTSQSGSSSVMDDFIPAAGSTAPATGDMDMMDTSKEEPKSDGSADSDKTNSK